MVQLYQRFGIRLPSIPDNLPARVRRMSYRRAKKWVKKFLAKLCKEIEVYPVGTPYAIDIDAAVQP